MIPYDTVLLNLGERIHQEVPLSTHQGRARLESSVRSMVRVASRGIGQEPLLNWIRQQINSQCPGDSKVNSPQLIRELCDRIVERIAPVSSRETVVGP